jgi:hypothetical protein
LTFKERPFSASAETTYLQPKENKGAKEPKILPSANIS